MKLTQIMNENQENRPLSNEVKKHFLEIVSTYNKYQEMMDRKSDLATVAETLGGITEAARTLAIHEGDDWFDKQTIKRNMSELDKLGKEFDKVAVEATSLDQRLNGLYEDMGHILSRYYKMGEITEEQMKERLGMNESVGCGCGGTTESTCGCGTHTHESVNEDIEPQTKKIASLTGTRPDAVKQFVSKNALNITKLLKFIEKGKLSDRMDFVSALAGKPGNPIEKKVIKMFQESVNEAKSTKKGNTYYVDSNFVNLSKKGGNLKHLGMGDFAVDVDGGKTISFHRVSEKIPGFSGRTHRVDGNGDDFKKLTKLMGIKSESVNEEEELTKFGESVEKLMEKNVPTNPSKWSYYKAQAKKKFDVYPSAYANGWAAKQYKAAGGGWKKGKSESVNEAKFGYKDSTASYINKHKDEYKQAEKMNNGNEKRFYDMLQQMEEKVGHGKTMLFISNSLRGYGVDMFKDPKIKNPQDAQEALFLLSK